MNFACDQTQVRCYTCNDTVMSQITDTPRSIILHHGREGRERERERQGQEERLNLLEDEDPHGNIWNDAVLGL